MKSAKRKKEFIRAPVVVRAVAAPCTEAAIKHNTIGREIFLPIVYISPQRLNLFAKF